MRLSGLIHRRRWSWLLPHQHHADRRCGSDGAAGATHPADAHHLTGPGGTPYGQRAAAYLSAVLQALQNGQVVGPCVLGAEAGQVLPTGLLLRQLPTGRPSRLGGPNGGGGRCILGRWVDGSKDGGVGRLRRTARGLRAEDGDEAAETNGGQQQQQRGATVCRHLHITVRLVVVSCLTSGNYVHNKSLIR